MAFSGPSSSGGRGGGRALDAWYFKVRYSGIWRWQTTHSRFGGGVLRPLLDHLVDQAEVLGHVRGQEVVALQRILDFLDRLTSVLDVDFVEPLLQVQDFLGVQHDVGGLALEPT